MKTLKYFSILFVGFVSSFNLLAQVPLYTADAVRYSQTDGGGTARFVGLGGANVSLGGDISSISGNPAGLGFYNRSSWVITPVLRIGNYSATYEGNTTHSLGGNFQIPNMGMVIHNRIDAGSKWVSGTFGVAINQKQSFYNNVKYKGTVTPENNGVPNDFLESMLSPFIGEGGDLILYPSRTSIDPVFAANPYSNLASYVGLLSIFPEEDEFGNRIGNVVDRYDYDQLGSAKQSENISTYSGLTTLDLSYGANYNDVLYLGAALNVNFLNYRQERRFREQPNNNILNYYEINEENNISGTGAALTIGAIYKPINLLNLGFSYTSPTIMALSETQTIDMDAYFKDGGVEKHGIENETPTYSFMSPQKVSVGVTAFLSKYGFVTADVEYVDYASTRYNSNNDAFGGGTPEVGIDLNSTFNAKVGVEARWNILRARVGYAYFDNPYKNFQQDRKSMSTGIGIMKSDGFFVDATYRLSSFNNPDFDAYSGSDIITSKSDISEFRITFGKSF